jgi:hypothetical protein
MIVIDVEIKKAILGRNDMRIEGIEYCKGWRDFAGMGIACVCTYDTDIHLSRVFLEEDFQELVDYVGDKPTAGFNTRRFDIPLLAANGIKSVNLPGISDNFGWGNHYDILEEIWIALGLNPDKFNPRTHGGWGLDAVCQATLGIAKTGNGALAPVWWQQGKRGKVIDYCLNDVWMEAQLLQWVIRHGWVTNNHKGQEPLLKVRRPALTCDPNFTEARRMASAGEPLINVESAYAKTPAAARDIRTVITPGLDESPSQVPLGGLGIIR